MIELKGISKTFRVAKREAGLGNALRSFFKREYEEVKALQDISFRIDEGEMVGYIGPNGAGKSSTIKIMSGVMSPDSGECIINGRVPWKERTAHVQQIGVVFGQRSQLWWDVPVADSFQLIRDIYRVPEEEYRKTEKQLIDMLDIGEVVKTPARQLSLGQRMRCEIAASLLHRPKILFLDEPTIGLDAVSKIAVRDFIKELNRTRGTTVILTTHDMQDIEALTQRILLIGKGKILLDGTLEELKARRSHYRTVTVDHSGACLPHLEGAEILQDLGGHAQLRLDTDILPVARAIAMISAATEIKDFSVEGESIDDLVVSLYKEFEI
ncbi:MAG: ABC transporter ATP-binding protein [Clostridia bacterium]|nr:ABC transporter ATP-binding protein [Clostridia bacterium]